MNNNIHSLLVQYMQLLEKKREKKKKKRKATIWKMEEMYILKIQQADIC